ncbi:glycosyl transferase [Bacillus sp. Y1]|nr:glycosyltransferase family 4 protein [Bacillus sp. Y1]AYA78078.1 glycosyl transferase [Bacillus sp. Y1]
MNKRVLIIRNFASEVNISSYNLQEIGLGKALVRRGYNCDVVYYSDKNTSDELIYEENGKKLIVKWTKAKKIMSNSIYYSLLKKSLLNQYDIILTTEYNQIMTFLLSILCPNKLYLYHGPYRDNNHKLIQKVYDLFFTPIISKRISKVFTKSDLAKDYLKNKGFKDVRTIGVGLDTERLEENINKEGNMDLGIKFNSMNLLYVGVLEDRRNIDFLFLIFSLLLKKNPNINLFIVGDGKKEDTDRYFELADKLKIKKYITHIKELQQSQLKYLYENVDLFLFPTNYDIFGMVILESMYCKLPVISTFNGGAQTLINIENGVIIDQFNEELWVEVIYKILMDPELRERLSKNAYKKIIEGFTWDKIVNKILSP